MDRRNIIVIVAPEIETWGNFKKMCEAKKLPYNYLKARKFPIIYKDYIIHKVPFN